MRAQPAAETMTQRDFRAMGSDITLIAVGPGASHRLDRAQRWLNAFELRFSRFLPLSELRRLNAAAGAPFIASPRLLQLVSLALRLASRSRGLFDPTVLRPLEDAGYDRSFDLMAPVLPARRARPHAGSWRDVRIDRGTRKIELPAGLGLDLGGAAKGWAVDRMATVLGTPGLVNGGGDVFAAGSPADGPAWRIGVADPFQPERNLMQLEVSDRGVATSSVLRRSWRAGDAFRHHLIDPRTARPSTTDAVQVTVIAPSTLLADYHAKVALLKGAEAGLAYLDREPAIGGVIVRRDGRVSTTVGLDAPL